MSVEEISLDGLNGLHAVLQRLPQGIQARDLAVRMGLWSRTAHDGASGRQREFRSDLSSLNESQLSDEYAYWLAEMFRVTELCGLLEGQRIVLSLRAKSTRASARARIRREHLTTTANETKPKTVTATQLNDEVEEDSDVQESDNAVGMLAVVQETAKAYKEATTGATNGLSREISFRQAQMNARIR